MNADGSVNGLVSYDLTLSHRKDLDLNPLQHLRQTLPSLLPPLPQPLRPSHR